MFACQFVPACSAHPLVHAPNGLLTCPCICTPTLLTTHSLTHSLSHPFTLLSIYSLNYSLSSLFTLLPIHSLIDSLSYPFTLLPITHLPSHTLPHLPVCLPICTLIPYLLTPSESYLFNCLLVCPSAHSSIQVSAHLLFAPIHLWHCSSLLDLPSHSHVHGPLTHSPICAFTHLCVHCSMHPCFFLPQSIIFGTLRSLGRAQGQCRVTWKDLAALCSFN